MDRNSLNEKSLELIRKTKEFLQVKKTYDDIQSVFLLIKQAKDESDNPEKRLELLPERVLALVRTAGNLDQAENLALNRMKDLKDRMAELSLQIKKISEQLEPYVGKPREQPKPQLKKQGSEGRSAD
jgi:hypothetical protein